MRGVGQVVLSERNVLTLLSKLYTPGSACTITNGPATVQIEPDHLHYHHPERLHEAQAGAMHPVTERILKAIHEAAQDVVDIHQDPLPLDYPEAIDIPNSEVFEDHE